MAILSLDAIFNAGRVQSGLASMGNMIDTVGRRLRGVESSANRARSALRQMNTEQLSATRIQGRSAGGQFSSIEQASSFGVRGVPGASFRQAEEAQSAIDNVRRSTDRLTQSNERLTTSSNKSAQANRRQGVSFTQLLGLMIKFGIAMEIINFPGRIIGLFTGIIRGGTEAETSLAGVNALLRVSKDEIMDLGRVTRGIAADFGVTGDAFEALEQAASALGGFPSSQIRVMKNDIRLANDELQTTADLFRLASIASVAGGVQIQDTMRAATTITSGFGVSVKEAELFMDVLFKTVDKGNVQMDELSRTFGELTGGLQLLFGNDPKRQLKEFTDVMTGFAVSTQTLTPPQAGTALRNLLKGFVDASVESTKLRNRLKELGVSLTVNDIISQGYAETLREMNRTIAPQGRIIDDLVAANKEQVEVMGEANFRQSQWVAIVTGLFPNIRQTRSLQAQLNDEMRVYNAFAKDMANFTGETNKQFVIQQNTLANSVATFKQFIFIIKEELFSNLGAPLQNSLRQINAVIEQIVGTKRFTSSSFIEKLTILWEGFITAFNKWWTGGGRDKTISLTGTIATALTTFLISPAFLVRFTEVGTVIGLSLAGGIIKGIAQGLVSGPSLTENLETKRISDIERIKTLPDIGNRNELLLFDIKRLFTPFTQGSGLSTPEEIRNKLGFINSGGTTITVESIQVGNSAEEIGQVILDLAAGLDDGAPAAPRDDRINNP